MVRLVMYEDFNYGFLTNDFTLPAITIAELYRERWNVELLFKWIKQHLYIKAFFRTPQNAVYAQIWIAICDYLLLIIAKRVYHMKQYLCIFTKAVGLVLEVDLSELFNRIDKSKLES